MSTVTYSPKVFIPLTMLCRDRCGYCTFAKAPARLDSPYLTPDEVLAIAVAGARAGCHEALITRGEAPEARYPLAAAWLAANGDASTLDYLVALMHWGDRWAVAGDPSTLLVHDACGAELEQTLRCPDCDVEVTPTHIRMVADRNRPHYGRVRGGCRDR
jgi:hypothetical protein